MTIYNQLMNSTFLDAYGANQYTAAQYNALATGGKSTAEATLAALYQYGPYSATVHDSGAAALLTIALVLNRQNDPTDLLTSSSWAERQAALADQHSVFQTYGAAQSTFDQVRAAMQSIVGKEALDIATARGFVSSAEDRTIWATVTADQFKELFGNTLLTIDSTGYNPATKTFVSQTQFAWTGDLGLASSISTKDVGGVWFERDGGVNNPAILDSTPVTIDAGPLGIGNDAGDQLEIATPAAIAANYNFPLPSTVQTPAVALVESDISQHSALFAAYNDYRQTVGLPTVSPDKFVVVSGPDTKAPANPELTLDISTVAGGVPTSTQYLYALLSGTPFAGYQKAFFDHEHDPHILTSSYSAQTQATVDSPFYWAWQQLFVDGALRNISVHNAAGDQGSTGYIYNGVSNVTNWQTSPFALQVGGTSIAGRYSAGFDKTLDSQLAAALQGAPAALLPLVAAGLKTLPSLMPDVPPTPADAATTLATLFETVWQTTTAFPDPPPLGRVALDFGANEVGSGGIASLVPIPDYQHDFGISSMTDGARGMPDVSALSAGDTLYAVLNSAYIGDATQPLLSKSGGTSAATPLWASLTAQIDTIFKDQGLPQLGYYNDLLYNAAAITPASFNDITVGNNANTFYLATQGPDYNDFLGLDMVPTGNGYSAQAGYDLASGLGTPNGTILARTLTAIAHAQTSYGDLPPVLDFSGQAPMSGADQSLLFQTTSGDGAAVFLSLGSKSLFYTSAATAGQAWTSQLAGQALQSDFDPALVVVFDGQAQGTVVQRALAPGESLSVTIDAAQGRPVQGALTTDYGFVDYMVPKNGSTVPSEMVRAARPIAIAETVDGLDDQTAIVRIRQDGTDKLSVAFYKVDDLVGSIGGVLPGSAKYAEQAAGRAYHTETGATSIDGPGYGKFAQHSLVNVDSGDLIAMKLTNVSTQNTYWAFAQANETSGGQPVAHLWNYGLDTWGWEDRPDGGDHDFNDLIVGLDFTSSYGSGWLT